ncbi:MAG: class I SAM-dependent methyltransferase [Chloroflexi bacterium]|nr:class I SAM-dependent methyltransferase [Chloroflexota bacterium]
MIIDLADTKERALPHAQTREDYLVYLKHVALYDFAKSYSEDKTVLDLGCGEGYGSAALARSARFVVAADYDFAAVAHAAQKYGTQSELRSHAPSIGGAGVASTDRRARLAFVVCDAQRLPFQSDAFGVVVSFEVIEHIPNVAHYLAEIKRVSAAALISTPNRALRLLPFQKPWNRYHLREYAAQDFARTLASVFLRAQVRGVTATPVILETEKRRVKQNPLIAYPKMLAQMLSPRAVRTVAKRHPPQPAAPPAFSTNDYSAQDFFVTDETKECINLLAVCAR